MVAHDIKDRLSNAEADEVRRPLIVADLAFVPTRFAQGWHVRDEHHFRIEGKRLGQRVAQMIGGVLREGFQEGPALALAHASQFGDELVVVHHHGRTFVIADATVRPAIVADAEALLEEMLNKAAISGQINVPPREAARSILAANVGVTLMLIAEPVEDRNLELSTMTRDSMIFAVSTDTARGAAAEDSGKSSVVVAAIALNAALQASHSDQLSSSELKLFLEWLHRISSSS